MLLRQKLEPWAILSLVSKPSGVLALVCDVGVSCAINYPLWPVASCQADALDLRGGKSHTYF